MRKMYLKLILGTALSHCFFLSYASMNLDKDNHQQTLSQNKRTLDDQGLLNNFKRTRIEETPSLSSKDEKDQNELINLTIDYCLEVPKRRSLEEILRDNYDNFKVSKNYYNISRKFSPFITCSFKDERGYIRSLESIKNEFVDKLVDEYKNRQENGIQGDFSLNIIAPYTKSLTRNYLIKFNEKRYNKYLESIKGYLAHRMKGTTNGRGSEVYHKTFLLNEYLSSLKAGDKVLDIGTASGNNSLLALNKGVNIIANDINFDALEALEAKIESKYINNILLNAMKFPYDLKQENNSFDKILLSHVIHYLSEEEILSGITKLYQWLKVEGQVFLQSLSPYSLPFLRGTKDIIKENLISLSPFNEEELLWDPSPKYFDQLKATNMPEDSHPITLTKLKEMFEKVGFSVTYANYNTFKHEADLPITYQEHELYVKHNFTSKSIPKEILSKLQEIKKKVPSTQRKEMKKDRKKYHSKRSGRDDGLSSMPVIALIATKV